MVWLKPHNPYVKVNVKGLFDRGNMTAVVGCVLRVHSGRWIHGCGGNIGLVLPDTVELWSIFMHSNWLGKRKKRYL